MIDMTIIFPITYESGRQIRGMHNLGGCPISIQVRGGAMQFTQAANPMNSNFLFHFRPIVYAIMVQ